MGSGEVAIVALSTMISLKVTFSDGLGGQAGAVHLILLEGHGAGGLQRGGGAQANGWAQICAQREREG